MSIWSAVGAAAGYYLGGPAGAMVGANIGGGIDRNNAAANSAEQAQQFSADQYASRYQTQVKDMQAAGLNPMLGYMQSPGNAPQGVTYQPTNPFERTASDYSSAANVERGGRKIEAETENLMKDIDVKDADIAYKNSMTSLNGAQQEMVMQSTQKIKQEITNLTSDNDRILALTEKLGQEKINLQSENLNLIEQREVLKATVQKLMVEVPYLRSATFLNAAKTVLTDAQVILTKAETSRTGAQTDLINQEAKVKGYDIAAIEKFDNFAKEYKQYSPIIDLLKTIFAPRSAGITINK